jgi:hypothetical protein
MVNPSDLRVGFWKPDPEETRAVCHECGKPVFHGSDSQHAIAIGDGTRGFICESCAYAWARPFFELRSACRCLEKHKRHEAMEEAYVRAKEQEAAEAAERRKGEVLDPWSR